MTTTNQRSNMNIIYRKLVEYDDFSNEVISIWQYNTKTKKERLIMYDGKIENDPWIKYTTVGGTDTETDITKKEADDLMFLEAI